MRTLHIMVADGYPNPEVDGWDVLHVRLPPGSDSGNTPRAIAGLIAANRGADAIALLAADNYFERDHIETLLALQRDTGAQVVTATRMLIRLDGTTLGVCDESDGKSFNDTNCYLLMKPAFAALSSWGYQGRRACLAGDRVFWQAIRQAGFTRAHCARPTVNYVTAYAHHYEGRGERPPRGAKIIVRSGNGTDERMVPYQDYLRLTQTTQRQGMTSPTAVALEELRRYKVLIGTPMYGGSCTGQYANASIKLATQLQAAGIPFGFAFVLNESLVTRARNDIADSFMRSDAGYTHLMFIDADIDYRPEDVLTALAVQHAHGNGKNIICAPYPRKAIAWDNVKAAVEKGLADQDPAVLENYVGDFVVGLDQGKAPTLMSDLLEVTAAGTCFMLIARRVFEDFAVHYPELKYARGQAKTGASGASADVMCYFDAGIDPETRTYISEDYSFLKKARAIGHSAWMVPWINLGHVGTYRFSGNLIAVNAVGASVV